MNFKTLYLFLFSLILFTFKSCKNGDGTELISTNFSDEIFQKQNLIFTFNKDLGINEAMDQWFENNLLEFQPSVVGSYKWTAKNELVFSADNGFLPSTDYKIKFSDSFVKKYGNPNTTTEQLSFHTPYLNLTKVSSKWSKKSSGVPGVNLALEFNYPVDPVDVSKKLKIKVGDEEKSIKLVTSNKSKDIKIEIENLKTEGKAQEVSVFIEKGLTTDRSSYKADDLKFESTIPSIDQFKIVSVEAESLDSERFINVFTNQQISGEEIKDKIKVSPQIYLALEHADHGFIVKGNFKEGSNYTLTIPKGLESELGIKLSSEFEQTVIFGEVDPSIAFAEKKAIYLTSAGNKQVAIKITKVPSIELEVYKIYENNILSFLAGSNDYYDYYYDYSYNRTYSHYELKKNGDKIISKTLNTNGLKKSGGNYLIDLNLPDYNDFGGIYLVEVRSKDQRYLRDQKKIAISDIGLIAKQGKDEIIVFANSILSGKKLSNVKVSFISSNNQKVHTVETDGSGVARFKGISQKVPGFKIQMITARSKSDFTYLDFSGTKLNYQRSDVDGAKIEDNSTQAYIYGERNLYRPGETINLKAILRDKNWKTLSNYPVKIQFYNPSSKIINTQKGETNENGSIEASLDLPVTSITGMYRVELLASNGVFINSWKFSVEEFMPDRIKVNVSSSKKEIEINESVSIEGQALNLFGPPATNRNYEVSLSMNKKWLHFSGLDHYDFQLSFPYYKDPEFRTGITDENGEFKEDFSFSETYDKQGVYEGTVVATVFDETGRPVARKTNFEVVTQDTFLGIGYLDYYQSSKKPIEIPLIAVNKEGKVYNKAAATIQVVKYEWHSVLQKDYNGKYKYVSEKKEIIKKEEEIKISGKATKYSFKPDGSGKYEVRLMLQGAKYFVATSFYTYAWGSTNYTSFNVDKEGDILLEYSKEKYNVGEEANVILKTPFEGKVLLTIENDDIIDYQWIETDKRTLSYSFDIKKEYLPNAYITATLIKPLTDNQIPLTVAHGAASFTVEDPSTRFELKINAPEKSRSNKTREITIQSDWKEKDIEVTLAVVDEGILQIKNYQNPDPHSFFFQKRALQTNTYDLYAKLFPELELAANQFGGGFDEEVSDYGMRLNPLANGRVKLVSFWSGTLKTNSKGEVSYPLEIPEFSGSLRVMAVAAKGNKYASASQSITVSDPVVISTGMPRFLSPKDKVNVPITLTNTTDQELSINLQLEAEGAIAINGKGKTKLVLPPKKEKVIDFEILAKNEIGQGKLVAKATSGGEEFTNNIEITVRPPTSLLKSSGSGVVQGGKKIELDMKKDFLEKSINAKLIVSQSPMIEWSDQLQDLIGYPYGCVEQTVSKAFPQIYLPEIAKTLGSIFKNTDGTPEYNVSQAINKLYSMQMYNGALSYWPGGTYSSWWGTAYAAHFLQEAEKAGFNVDTNFLKKIYIYLSKEVKNKKKREYKYFNAANQYYTRTIAPREIFYTLYVLANAGEPDISTMNYYKNKQDLLTLDSKYMLALAYLINGDAKTCRKLMPNSFKGEKSMNTFSGSFNSYIRDMAMALNGLIETDNKNPQIADISYQLSNEIKRKKYLNTQEQAFALLAFGKMAKEAVKSNISASITFNNQTIASYKPGEVLTLGNQVSGKKISIEATGEGKLYYFWYLEGLNESGEYPQEDERLRVRRVFYNKKGDIVKNNNFQQNDLVVIEVSLNSDGATVENVVVTDMLPACFEIENPRISNLTSLQWIKNQSYPEHTDFRDDRVNFFTTATSKAKKYYYTARVVSKGEYQMGPISADAMYDGSYHSYHGSGMIEVE